MSRYWYLLVFIFPFSLALGYLLGDMWNFTTLVLTYVIIPILELICGKSFEYPSAIKIDNPQHRRYYQLVLYTFGVLQIIIVILGAYAITHTLNLIPAVGLTIGIGINGGIAFNIAHELIHKHNYVDNLIGKSILVTTCTGHACTEHVIVHHSAEIAGTPIDHVHAHNGESFYHFYLKAMLGLRRAGFLAEKKRLEKINIPAWHYRNSLLRLNFYSLILLIVLTVIFGWAVLPYFIGQSIVASIVILTAAYMQHYGLERIKLADGTYEKYSELHAWNSNYTFTNYLLFQLPRHSLHHMQPYLHYESAYDNPDNPQMPLGYFVSGILILIPPLWHRIMSQAIFKNIKKRHEILASHH